MSIEVKQLVVKSNVVQRCETDEETSPEETQKQQVLDECKKLILETLREQKER